MSVGMLLQIGKVVGACLFDSTYLIVIWFSITSTRSIGVHDFGA